MKLSIFTPTTCRLVSIHLSSGFLHSRAPFLLLKRAHKDQVRTSKNTIWGIEVTQAILHHERKPSNLASHARHSMRRPFLHLNLGLGCHSPPFEMAHWEMRGLRCAAIYSVDFVYILLYFRIDRATRFGVSGQKSSTILSSVHFKGLLSIFLGRHTMCEYCNAFQADDRVAYGTAHAM